MRPWGGIYQDAVVRPLTLDPVDGNEKFADAAGSKAGAIADQYRKKMRFRHFGGGRKNFNTENGFVDVSHEPAKARA